ncbi:MAG: hypothetical protein M1838_005529 [Thelocarpon superellum]|nr:MAG: hypothetical protein M1838_005529 [Thelocarpon superellum]
MLVRSVLGRAVKGATATRARVLAGSLHTSAPVWQEKVAAREVPVYTYTSEMHPVATSSLAGSISSRPPIATTLPVDEAKSASSVDITEPVDETQDVVGLKDSVYSAMPHTLKNFTLQGKVAVITGGARGLGYNIAEAFAEVGCKAVIIMDVQQELGDSAAAAIHARSKIPVKFYKVDVRDESAIAEVVENASKSFGSIDVVVNAAGIADSNIKAMDYDTDRFRRLIDINVTGSFLIAQACGRTMIQAGNGGSIIFIASMSGTIVNFPQEQSCYNASKAAVIQLAKSLAAEWAQHNIRVNCISPGYMDTALNRVPALDAQKRIWTEKTPQQRLGQPDELNNLAVFLASSGSSFMTGTNCIIDMNLFDGAIDG